jgi:hypothetical protein
MVMPMNMFMMHVMVPVSLVGMTAGSAIIGHGASPRYGDG